MCGIIKIIFITTLVSKKKKDGDSNELLFIQKTMWMLKQNNHLTEVNLYVDSWNSIKLRKGFGKNRFLFKPKTKEIKMHKRTSTNNHRRVK